MAFPGGAYGSMPMFFPQPGYAQQSWPVMQSMPVQVPVAMPPTIQAQQAASLPGQLQLQSSAPQGATVQGNLIQPYPTYGFVVPQTITEQQQVQTTQVPQDDGEPDLEEAKMTMLARYYKNPIYGLKANLARLKAEKKAKENRAAAERKALLDQKQYLQDAMGDFEKDMRALEKRERYWKRTAKGEGMDKATIENERQFLAIRRRQLLDTRDYLVQQKRTLRDSMRAAGVDVSESEATTEDDAGERERTSSSSSSASAESYKRPARRGRSRDRKRKGKTRDGKPDARRSRSKSKRKVKDGGSNRTECEDSATRVERSRRRSTTPDALKLGQAQRRQSTMEAPMPETYFDANRGRSHSVPAATRVAQAELSPPYIFELNKESTSIGPSRPNDIRSNLSERHEGNGLHSAVGALPSTLQPGPQLRTATKLTPNRSFEPNNAGEVTKSVTEAPLMEVIFSSNRKYELTLRDIAFDCPNAFQEVLHDAQHRLKPGKKLRVPINDRSADLFEIVHQYLQGYSIFPLGRDIHETLGTPPDKPHRALGRLLKEARFYGLSRLQHDIEEQLQQLKEGRSGAQQQQPSAPISPPSNFVILDLNRKGQSIELRDLEHISASKLSRRRILKTLPHTHIVATGAAINFGTRPQSGSGKGEHDLLQYSIAIPESPLGIAFQQEILQSAGEAEGSFFIEGSVDHFHSGHVNLEIDFMDEDRKKVSTRKTNLNELLICMTPRFSGNKAIWDDVFLATFRLFKSDGSEYHPSSAETTPASNATKAEPRIYANLPIATVTLEVRAEDGEYKVELCKVATKTRQLEALDGYQEMAALTVS